MVQLTNGCDKAFTEHFRRKKQCQIKYFNCQKCTDMITNLLRKFERSVVTPVLTETSR
jgi:hypothetical protein